MNAEDCPLEAYFISSVLPNGDQEKVKNLFCTEQQQQQQKTNITAANGCHKEEFLSSFWMASPLESRSSAWKQVLLERFGQ